MSAALVESVREAVKAHHEYGQHDEHRAPLASGFENAAWGLDWPAILAALTEAEALRAQVAESQAREVALRRVLVRWAAASDDARRANLLLGMRDDAADREYRDASDALMRSARNESPTDTAALRAFGERCVLAGWVGGNNYAFPDEPEELVIADIPPDAQQQITAIVDRVLGGS